MVKVNIENGSVVYINPSRVQQVFETPDNYIIEFRESEGYCVPKALNPDLIKGLSSNDEVSREIHYLSAAVRELHALLRARLR